MKIQRGFYHTSVGSVCDVLTDPSSTLFVLEPVS